MSKPDTWAIAEALRESNAIEEVYSLDALIAALNAWVYLEQVPLDGLNSKIVCQVQKCLMINGAHGNHLLPHQKGYYRDLSQTNVRVGSRLAPDYGMVPGMMDNWLLDYKDLSTKEAHIRFEKIHPFVDGNGRTGRIIMYWMMWRRGEPFEWIKDAEKQAYYKWFKDE